MTKKRHQKKKNYHKYKNSSNLSESHTQHKKFKYPENKLKNKGIFARIRMQICKKYRRWIPVEPDEIPEKIVLMAQRKRDLRLKEEYVKDKNFIYKIYYNKTGHSQHRIKYYKKKICE
ncbi:hypothetical protein F1737_08345 [Methanoplanus sp. FWC-SCC4]|uniref:Uncharacterized protein n=1 Tax=Methanochimaera problematica TaxID=2609417 RepID=A0AA97I4T4_9EURY|nr:hypothetical protein [Methanoplanus sp. FWC-SCC4]WOF16696.1 hypothetical protein F1737_08345 [Methanoplanus sp. FWC-SCC4]